MSFDSRISKCVGASVAILMCLATNILRAADPPAAAQTVTLPATVEAFEASDQYAKDSGYVSEVKVDIGDHVNRGQVLVAIDDPELAKQVDAAKATLAARREMAKASEASVQQAAKAIEVTRSQLAVYQADLELAEATIKRQQELYSAKAITDQTFDEAKDKASVARAQALVGQAKVAMAEADLQAANANRAVAEAQVTVADAEAQRLSTLLEYTTIKAPFDGIVTRRWVNRGDLIMTSRNAPLMTVQRIDTVRVFSDVPEGSAALVTAGIPATVKLYGSSGAAIEAKVTRIAGALDPNTRTMHIEIDLPNAEERLRPGMYAQVTLTLQK